MLSDCLNFYFLDDVKTNGLQKDVVCSTLGHVQGFSGIPFGPNNHPASPYSRRKKRIVNGGAANYGEWPWQIRMLQFKKYRFFCGGSLLNKEWASIKKFIYKYGQMKPPFGLFMK